MLPGYKDLLYLQPLSTEPDDVYPAGNNLLLKPLDSALAGQKRAASGTVFQHIPFLETERLAAVIAVEASVLPKMTRVDAMI